MDKTLQRLARYATRTSFGELTPEAVHETKRRLIDSVACAAGAYEEPFCVQVRAVADRYAGKPPARIWGTGAATSVEMAAFANGTMVRYLDLSDTHLGKGAGHPSDMIPALVAVAEVQGSDGRALIAAIVVAYELYCGLAEAAFGKRVLDQATAAAVGAAAGAARLFNVDEAAMANAISLALAPNLNLYNVRCGQLSDWKGCAGPNGARNGVFAAMLAADGVSGPTAPVEGQGGLIELIGPFDWQVGTGAQPMLVGTHLKLHPVCYHGQSGVDAAIRLRSEVPVDRIAAIDVETYDAAFRVMASDEQRWAPATRETADHSLPYTIAIALQDGRLESASYADERLADTATRQLMQKIRVNRSEEMTRAYPARSQTRITIRDTEGATHTFLQEQPLGHAANPVSDAGLEDKFAGLYPVWGDTAAAKRTLGALWSLERQEKVTSVVDTLCSTR